eukprot:SAG25_NODE_194_length_12183_cov_70.943893_2_plen_134_part_00
MVLLCHSTAGVLDCDCAAARRREAATAGRSVSVLCYPHYAVYMPAMPCAVHAQECRLLAREQQQQRFQVLTDRQQAAGRQQAQQSSCFSCHSRQQTATAVSSSSSSSSRRAPIRGIRGLQVAYLCVYRVWTPR